MWLEKINFLSSLFFFVFFFIRILPNLYIKKISIFKVSLFACENKSMPTAGVRQEATNKNAFKSRERHLRVCC